MSRNTVPQKKTQPDWQRLERLRNRFLEGNAGDTDYWECDQDLAEYDATYAQRIGWKWEYVLADLRRCGWRPAHGPLIDWGCGSGIAHRVLLDLEGGYRPTALHLHDRSPRAVDFAMRKARARFPGVRVEAGLPLDPTAPGGATVLLSHVLTELGTDAVDHLVEWLMGAETILWVEPGTHAASRVLIEVRERLRKTFQILAPCTHARRCPLLAVGNEGHWCHQFATVPAPVFTDSGWGRFAQETGIDLRSLPVSYLVLDRRTEFQRARPQDSKLETARLLGRPRVYKAHAQVMFCSEAGAQDYMLQKRTLPEVFRLARKERFDGLRFIEVKEDEVVSCQEVPES